MEEILSMLPYKFIFAGYNYLPALLILSFGGDSVSVGIINSIYYFGLFLAPLLWSRFSKKANHKSMITLGYATMAIGLIMISHSSLIYLATFILAFFPQSIYFGALSELKKKKGSLSEKLGRLEQTSGLAWAFGLIVSFFMVQFFSLSEFSLILALLSILSFPFISFIFHDFGFLKMASRSIHGLREFQTWLFSKSHGALISNIKEVKLIYLLICVYSISSGIIILQLPTLITNIFGAGSLVYICSFVGSIASASLFKVAGRLKYSSYKIGYVLKMLGFGLLLSSIYFESLILLLLFYLVNGFSWSFIMMFFEYASLKVGEEVFGTAIALRLLAIAIFSVISGYLIKFLGFFNAFLIGVVIMASTILIYKKFEKNQQSFGVQIIEKSRVKTQF